MTERQNDRALKIVLGEKLGFRKLVDNFAGKDREREASCINVNSKERE